MINKILVSDYDGTLKKTEKILKLNIEAINKFRKQENIFVLSTGRPYYSIIEEIKKYNIRYDYLNCQDGSLLFDRNNKLLYADRLNEKDSKDIKYILDNLSNIRKYKVNGIKEQMKNVNHSEVIEYEVLLENKKNTKEFITLLKKVKEELAIYSLFNYVYIKNSTTKSDGIKKLLEIENIQCTKIITVGDGQNDIEMLKDFEGYKMLNCHRSLIGKKIKTTSQVFKLIK